MKSLEALETPALLLDRARFDANITRMRDIRAQRPGVSFRPHVKTMKSLAAIRRAAGEGTAITVSTLLEAEQFFAGGFSDILYAVGIGPSKLPRAAKLVRAGAALSIVTDNITSAQAIIDFVGAQNVALPVLLEIDTDGHRSGLKPDAPEIITIGHALHAAGLLAGVMTHAGESYNAPSLEGVAAVAELERAGVVKAARRLRAAGLGCAIVSVGSTPTALYARDMTGVTEVRAGVFMAGDLVMAGVGVQPIDSIALSVLGSVIGHQADRGWVIIDAGWMAMSRDRGTERQSIDQGYGLVCDIDGTLIDGLNMVSANQEHGIIARRDGGAIDPAAYPIGRRLRILPNHACATGAQHGGYHVIADGKIADYWPRFSQW